jgi:Na+/melibiose symporter-like transporter
MRINKMTAAVIITGSILGVIGIGFSIWSIINTRKRYYEEYMRRKRRAED